MNINAIKSGDSIDVLSPLRSVNRTSQDKNNSSKAEPNNNTATKLDNKPGTMPENQLKTEQNSQLANDQKTVDKQKEDDKLKSSMKDANKLVEELNDYMNDLQTSLGFSVTKDPENQIVFQIKDRSTNEVIKQIPSEEIQKIKEKMDELTGLLLDQHA